MKLVYDDGYVDFGSRSVLIRRVIEETTTLYADLPSYISTKPGETYERLVNGQKVVTTVYENTAIKQFGQQGIAGTNENAEFLTAASCSLYLSDIIRQLVLADVTVRTSRDRILKGIEKRPPVELRMGMNGSNYRGEFKSELLYTTGSPTSSRIIELSMPYQSDDYYSATGAIVKGDAATKASRYGRSQNRLLLGNRSGMNIQTPPELLPAAPFSPIIVQANGLSAMYRTNGTNWQMNADGILVSTDALFYGAVGGTGTFWFPVAPGITALPTTPAVVDGQMTVSSVVPVWNETVKTEGRLRVGLGVQSLGYPLTLLTTPNPIIVNVGLGVRKISNVDVPAGSVAVAGVVPAVSIGAAIRPSSADIAVAGLNPAVAFGCAVQVPAADVAVAGAAPAVSVTLTTVLVPAANVALVGATPDLQAGDDYYSNLAAQVFTLLRDWRVDWWGD